MKKIIASALALVMLSAVPSVAQTYRSEGRENRQDYRIFRGAVQGEITPREMHRLQRQQDRIDRTQRRASRDGYISPRERRQMERQQNRASRNIYRKTHNGRILY
jgi:hypothetical protein